ncbi:MAG: major capsid protein [Treponema sp.]|nr:major capsid protein [Treponema sp.]
MPPFIEKVLTYFKSIPDLDKMGFLSSFFKTKEEDFTTAELVDIDIVRSGEMVAPALRNLRGGAVAVSDDIFTGKQVRPPVYALERTVNIFELMKRQPGETQFKEIGDWVARLSVKIKSAFDLMYAMIKRSIELQASQVFQTGTVTLTDEKGNALDVVLDFKPKATHFPAVTTAWSNSAADPIADLTALARTIRKDGQRDVANAIFGYRAWQNFIENAKVKAVLDLRRADLAAINPRLVNKGGAYMGYINLGAYRVNLLTYDGTYETFDTKASMDFVEPDNVILTADITDLDFRLVYGGVPDFDMDEPFSQIIPAETKVDDTILFHNRVYRDTKQRAYTSEVTCRPICIPVSIDRFGCLKTAL